MIKPGMAAPHDGSLGASCAPPENCPTRGVHSKTRSGIEPFLPPTRQWYAGYLQTLDRIDQCFAEHTRALEIDPLSMVARAAREGSLYLERQYDRVIAESRHTLKLDPRFVLAYFTLGRASLRRGSIARRSPRSNAH